MKRVRCLIGLHNWVEHVREEEHYLVCRDCGKYHPHASAIFRHPGSRP